MKMYLNDGKRDVDEVEVSLADALEEIDKHPPCGDKISSYIGFAVKRRFASLYDLVRRTG